MTKIIGKTLYVLGAGCSHHAGAPLLRDFLLEARLLKEGSGELTFKDSFKRVFDWIDSLRGAAYYVDLDLDNIEHIFSLADMMKQIGMPDGEQHFSDLRYIVMETLDRCEIKWSGKRFQADSIYRNFSEVLKKITQTRCDTLSKAPGTVAPDTVITFNYDVMLDYAMRSTGIEPDYCLTASQPQRCKVLKLHGSTNWATCKNCHDKPLQIVKASPIPEGYQVDPFLNEDTSLPFKMVTDVLAKTKCTHCNETNVLEPLIIPPTWSKAVANSPMTVVWNAAVKEIRDAFQIVVIGYSLPNTDTFLQYLLALGLAENATLHRVVVVNLDGSEEMQKRYRTVFSRSLMARGRLKFLTEVSFEDFVAQYMEDVGTQLEWHHV